MIRRNPFTIEEHAEMAKIIRAYHKLLRDILCRNAYPAKSRLIKAVVRDLNKGGVKSALDDLLYEECGGGVGGHIPDSSFYFQGSPCPTSTSPV